MKAFVFASLLCVLCCCKSTEERAPSTWYPSAEVVCTNAHCPTCHGTCAVGCGTCRASGKVPCTSCKDGTQKCWNCGGDGQKGGKKCKTCDGKGKTACSTCGGTRLMACGTCSGKGKLMCLRPLHISEPMPTGDDVWPPQPKP